jgi:signal peptidase I
MEIDYTAALLSIAACMGAVILVGRFVRHGPAGSVSAQRVDRWLSSARALFPVILAVILIRAFVFEPFKIPSESMMPGLIDGDFIFVDKFSYGLRLPLLHLKLLSVEAPRRGDVIVFRLPSNPSVDYIKRLVGLPGDRIVIRDNRVSINGQWMPVQADGSYTGDPRFDGTPLELETFGQRSHVIMLTSYPSTDYVGTVPAGHYFFMGDNRNDSQDSRFPIVGFVPDRNIIGRARFIWLNWQLPGWPKLDRIGQRIR